MSIETIVEECIQNKVFLAIENSQLKLTFAGDVLDEVLLGKIKKNKNQLIKLLQAKAQEKNKQIDISVVANRHKSLPSFAQQRLWLADKLEAGNAHYNISAAYELQGSLNEAVLMQAICSVFVRHEVLRSVFYEENEQIYQKLVNDAELPFKKINLQMLNEQEKKHQVNKIILDDDKKNYMLTKEYPLRIVLLQLSKFEHVIIFNMHHIASDGWSVNIFLHEISVLYEAFKHGANNPLISLPIQYADYAQWQRDCLQGDLLSRQLAYWKKHLDGFPQTHSLPLDNQRSLQQSYSGKFYQHSIGQTLTEKIKRFCLEREVTQFMLLQTVFSLLLCRFSNETDIVIGSPIAGRTHKDVESLIGFFINTLVLRSKLNGNPDFMDFLYKNKQNILDAYAHQDVPFDMLVEELNPQRNLSISPVTQIRFILQNNERTEFSLSGLEIQVIKHSNDVAKFDITLTIVENNEGLVADWSYCSDIFKDETIQTYANSFITLLNSIIESPETRVQALPLLTDEEFIIQSALWNTNDIKDIGAKCINQIFSDQVTSTPDNIAILFENKSITYRELNEQSNQLAHYLISQGIQADDLLGLYFDRSIEMIVGILGVLKAGAAYVPLDPGNPSARLAHILEDSSMQMVLSHSAISKQLPAYGLNTDKPDINRKNIFCLDNTYGKEQLHKQRKTNPNRNMVQISPENIAYVIYTSGSTGNPKGVLIEHRSVVSFYHIFTCQLKQLGITEDSGWLWNSSYAFDASVKGILALCQGRTVTLTSKQQIQDVDKIILLLLTNNISIFNGPPLLVERIVERLEEQEKFKKMPMPVINFIIGGDNISGDLWNRVVNYCHVRKCKAINAYGPTETTINSCYAEISAIDKPMIGLAVNNTHIYILNQAGLPLPIGGIGELYIGGLGLARGYANRPELTAEHFVDVPSNHPFSSSADKIKRLYKTGDLVYCLANGQLVFIGRNDDQVKIRGYRIELNEIRYQLNLLPGVKDSLVSVTGDNDTKKLIAYVVPEMCTAISTLVEAKKKKLISNYNTELFKVLPDFMVPDVFILLDEIPLTVSGKIDFSSLPEEQKSDLQHETYVKPMNEIEELLCKHWQKLLKLKHIGINDDFFKIGGHSLLAMKLLMVMEKEFNIDVDVRDLFTHITIRLQAQLIEGKSNQAISSDGADAENKAYQIKKSSSIPRLNNRTNIRLSYAQQRLWFIDQLEGGSSHYNIPAAFKLEGELNEVAFKQALITIISRHEILRTQFKKIDDQLYQYICDKAEVSLILVNLHYIKPECQQHEINKYLTIDAQRIFDLSNELLFRIHLFNLSPQKNILLFNMHHIISDGWSIGILINELNILYQAYCNGTDNTLQALPIQYADYAHWQREWLQGTVLSQQLTYWKTQLEDIPLIHSLPLDNPRPARQSFTGQSFEQLINKILTKKIKILCKELNVTVFMFLQTTFSILLSRYSNETDIIIGCPIAGRMHKDIEFLIGFFVNSIVLRNNLENNPGFTDLLMQNKRMILAAYANQHIPFDQLVEELKPDRSLSYSPINQIRFVFQNTKSSKLSLSGLRMEAIEHVSVVAKYDMVLTIIDEGEELISHWSYNSDIFNEQTIKRYGNSYITLLNSILNEPMKNVQALSLLSEREIHQQLLEWNDNNTDDIKKYCIHRVFEQQVRKTPDNIAIVFKDQQLSYQYLNEQSNQLAHYLISQGIKPDTLIGLYFDRSVEMLIAILAVLKAGGAYVPLDPANPLLRIAYMLKDSALEIILTSFLLKERLLSTDHNIKQSIIHKQTIIALDCRGNQPCFQLQRKDNPGISDINLTPQHLAYVIYTSGSTGQPKGVLVEHQSVVNFYEVFDEQLKVLGIDKDSGWLWNASYAFDASVKGIIALCQGRTVTIATNEQVQDINEIFSLLVANNITVFNGPPLLIERILEKIQLEKIAGINLIVSGDVISKGLWNKLVDYCQYNKCKAINAYGPTEATVNACFSEIIDKDKIIIGKPVCNCFMYVLNNAGLPVPIGSIGELHLGGAVLARNYLNHPELSADKFISNHLTVKSSERLYKTGDLVRYQADGNLIFVGRNDQQIKIRGYRLELGEINNRLSGLKSVRKAHVLARQLNGEKKLIAYVVPEAYEELNNVDNKNDKLIRKYEAELSQVLPIYMVPQIFILLEKFPLTISGKVNLSALPDAHGNSLSRSSYVAPGNDKEKALHKLWQILLKVEYIGIDDNFFKIGGHSLLAMKLMTTIEKEFSVSISVRDLFIHLTIRQQGQLINEKIQELIAQKGIDENGLNSDVHKCDSSNSIKRNLKIPRLNNRHKTRLSYAQQRLWIIDQLEGNSTHYNISTAFQLIGNLNQTAFALALQSILQRHEVLRSLFCQFDGLVYQLLDVQFQIPLKKIDITRFTKKQQQQHISQLLHKDEQKPYILTSEYPFRVHLLKLSDYEHMVFFNMHHIASDGWSLKILVDELNSFYQAYNDGNPQFLAPLEIQYADYAQWQQDCLQGEVLAQQLNYWKMQLKDIPLLHSLPLDKTRPSKQSFAGQTHRHIIDKTLTTRIKALSDEYNVTLFMLIQTAFSILLGRYSNDSDIVIGCPIAGRTHKDLDPLVGFFVNTLVLRCGLDNEQTFDNLLEKNKQTILDAYTYQHIPFEMLVEELMPIRSLSHSPLFQVVLHLHNNDESQLNFADLELVKIEKNTKYSKFDLELSVIDFEDTFVFYWVYNSDLFYGETIQRLSNNFSVLLNDIVDEPEKNIHALSLLSNKEQTILLEKWNNTTADFPSDKCIHELFEEQVVNNPDAIALTFNDQQLSYQQLNQRANQFAHYLLGQGIELDSLIGVCVERSLYMLIAVLGILKAGGAYVPLDPDYPTARLESMLSDAVLPMIVSQRTIKEKIPLKEYHNIICLDDDNVIVAMNNYNSGNINKADIALRSDNLAYVIYTSGSTGKPKGVMLEHSGLVNLALSQSQLFHVHNNSRVLQFASLAFDAATSEWAMALTKGATLYLISLDIARSGQALSLFIKNNNITHATLPPTLLPHLIIDQCKCLQNLIVAGENCPGLLARQWQQGREFYNAYGPTEITVCASVAHYQNQIQQWHMGQAINNMCCYILNEQQLFTPIGAIGELYIGGIGIARGYLNQAQLSNESFIGNPFAEQSLHQSGKKYLYKTGDLVCWLTDGNLKFIGRVDDQVKIRGFRIELGEIEMQLSKLIPIKESVVLIKNNSNNDKNLVAYIVPNGSFDRMKKEQLVAISKQKLKSALPEYMIPGVFVILESLPLTVTGKLDRKALPDPDESDYEKTIYVAPGNNIQYKLCELWERILGLKKVGIHDNFFKLGGHSLLATQIVTRLGQLFAVNIPLKILFEMPTVAELSVYIEVLLKTQSSQIERLRTEQEMREDVAI